jgi:hypothetical protein
MPLVKCPHCRERLRPNRLALHLKKCIYKRRKDATLQRPKDAAVYEANEKLSIATGLENRKAQLEAAQKELDKKKAELAPEAPAQNPKPTTKKGSKK